MKEFTGTACSPLVTPPSSKSSSNSSTRSNDSANTPASSVTDHESAKTDFVEALVDSSCVILQSIWTTASSSNNNSSKISLKSYIQELLKRSRTSYSTLQIALYYLFKRVLKSKLASSEPRRAFLSALLIASKYNQDRTYSASAWSKMSGLPVIEINRNELALLKAMDWNAHISYIEYGKWCNELLQMSLISRKRRYSTNSAINSVEPSAAIKSLAAVAVSGDYNPRTEVAPTDNNAIVFAGTKRKAESDFYDSDSGFCKRTAHEKEKQAKNNRIYQWIVDVARESSKV